MSNIGKHAIVKWGGKSSWEPNMCSKWFGLRQITERREKEYLYYLEDSELRIPYRAFDKRR